MVARVGDQQIRGGTDVSYNLVLLPEILRMTKQVPHRIIVDVGCGTGVLTERLAGLGSRVVGVDLSAESIAIARSSVKRPPNADYVSVSIEQFAATRLNYCNLAVANMVLQDAPYLKQVCKALARVVRPRGHVAITLTHPWFWPEYWGYDRAPWFHYDREVAISAPFRISHAPSPVGILTHFHRPLAKYFDVFASTGLRILEFRELMPSPKVARFYPEPWRFPRFVSLVLQKEARRVAS
jgi:SAM-dependent methyltransferase